MNIRLLTMYIWALASRIVIFMVNDYTKLQSETKHDRNTNSEVAMKFHRISGTIKYVRE